MLNLLQAHNQWANRPADERFWTIKEAQEATKNTRDKSYELKADFANLRAEALKSEILLRGERRIGARMTHHSFGQLGSYAGAPPSYMRKLPATLATQCLNHGIKDFVSKTKAEGSTLSSEVSLLLYSEDGGKTDALIRAITSTGYTRVWDHQVFESLLEFEGRGWKVPPARPSGRDPRSREATEEDVNRLVGTHGLSVAVGDLISPAGIYASDHDMWCFMIDEDHPIDDGAGHRLGRGFFIWNNEVGQKQLGGLGFLYSSVCGNHIVWDAQEVFEFGFNHVGKIHERFNEIRAKMVKRSNQEATPLENKIKEARKKVIGKDKTEVLEELSKLCRSKRIQLPTKTLSAGYDLAERFIDRYGAPNTAWAFLNGLTQLSQQSRYADDRVAMDKAAGKVFATLMS